MAWAPCAVVDVCIPNFGPALLMCSQCACDIQWQTQTWAENTHTLADMTAFCYQKKIGQLAAGVSSLLSSPPLSRLVFKLAYLHAGF